MLVEDGKQRVSAAIVYIQPILMFNLPFEVQIWGKHVHAQTLIMCTHKQHMDPFTLREEPLPPLKRTDERQC